jgi:hypothetical protein
MILIYDVYIYQYSYVWTYVWIKRYIYEFNAFILPFILCIGDSCVEKRDNNSLLGLLAENTPAVNLLVYTYTIYVLIYIYMFTYIYLYMHIFHTYVFLYKSICIYTYVYIYNSLLGLLAENTPAVNLLVYNLILLYDSYNSDNGCKRRLSTSAWSVHKFINICILYIIL